MGFSSWVHLDVDRIVRETDAAFLIEIDGERHWIPKSQVSGSDRLSEGDEDVTVSVTEWIADQKGLGG